MTAPDNRSQRDADDIAAVITAITALAVADEQRSMPSPAVPRELWGNSPRPSSWPVGPHQWWGSGLPR